MENYNPLNESDKKMTKEERKKALEKTLTKAIEAGEDLINNLDKPKPIKFVFCKVVYKNPIPFPKEGIETKLPDWDKEGSNCHKQ